MPVYLIANYDVEDSEAHDSYILAADPILVKHGGEILAAGDEVKELEGQARMVNVIIKFESEASAMDFYNDPDYKRVKQIRLDSTKNRTVILAPQFVFPPM